MANTKNLDLPNGDKATIYPNDIVRNRVALKALAKSGVRLAGQDIDFLDGSTYGLELAKAVIVSYECKIGESFETLNTNQRNEFIENHPKITNWLMIKANEFAAEQDKEFDIDSKN